MYVCIIIRRPGAYDYSAPALLMTIDQNNSNIYYSRYCYYSVNKNLTCIGPPLSRDFFSQNLPCLVTSPHRTSPVS